MYRLGVKIMTNEMLDCDAKSIHDQDVYTTASVSPAFSTLGIVTFALGLIWLALTCGGAE